MNWLDFIGTIIGLIYIYQEYNASVWLWLTGVVMPVVYMFVYLDAGLYADFGMQVYYVLAGIYGFCAWRFFRRSEAEAAPELPISHMPRRYYLPLLVVFVALQQFVFWLLANYTDSHVPFADAFGNALSIIGLWALARKYIEQWLIWIVVDAELAALYMYKGLTFTSLLYALYVVIAVAGYFKWRRMMAVQQPA